MSKQRGNRQWSNPPRGGGQRGNAPRGGGQRGNVPQGAAQRSAAPRGNPPRAGRPTGRMVRAQLARERRRRRIVWASVITAIIVVIIGGVGYSVYRANRPTSYNTPATATGDGSGLLAAKTSGPVKVEFYYDYLCPACKAFETSLQSTIDSYVKANKITLVYHPVAILDRSSTTNYSTRASASAGCAADGGKLYEYTKAMYEQQPAEGSAGLSDDQLVQIGAGVGLIDPSFARCVRDGRYKSWSGFVTDQFTKRGGSSTPTIYVDGKQLQGNTLQDLITAFPQAVDNAAAHPGSGG